MATVKFTNGAPVREPADRWTTAEAAELYDVASWGKGYFSVGTNGHLWVHPEKDPNRALDLKQLVDNLQLRGISLPILIRFGEILKHRLGEMHQAFQNAIAEHGYQGDYCCVYPDQGQPAAAGGRGSLRVRPSVPIRPGGRLEAGAAGRAGHRRQRHADHLQRL